MLQKKNWALFELYEKYTDLFPREIEKNCEAEIENDRRRMTCPEIS